MCFWLAQYVFSMCECNVCMQNRCDLTADLNFLPKTKMNTELRAVFNVLVARARQRAQTRLVGALATALPSDKYVPICKCARDAELNLFPNSTHSLAHT